MVRTLALLVVVGLCGCKMHDAPAPADAPAEQGQQMERLGGERCAHIQDMSDAMHCEIAPYLNGTLHDEAAFRKALEQIRDNAPSDQAFFPPEHSWTQITQTMLDTKDYKAGCGQCHNAYRKLYKARFEGSQISWTDVHTPTAAK